MAFIIIFLPLVATITSCLCFTSALTFILFLSPNGSETWTNNDDSVFQTVRFTDDSLARFILLTEQSPDLRTGLCFYCSSSAEDACYLSVIMLDLRVEGNSTNVEEPPQVVWSANHNSHVGRDATLKLYSGGLVLKDADGNNVWNSPTLSKSIGGVRISKHGNMVLFDQSNGTVWQSFDHPTDTLLIGQTLREGKCLTSGTSSVNPSLPLFRLCIYESILAAFLEVERSTQYLTIFHVMLWNILPLQNVTLNSGELSFVYQTINSTIRAVPIEIPLSLFARFLKLDDDGGVRIYGWDVQRRWQANSNIFGFVEDCQFPLKCGRYGVCQRGQAEYSKCSCPVAVDGKKYFKLINSQLPEVGCSQKASLSQQTSSENYQLINFGRLSYFSYDDRSAAIPGLDTEESCKQTCLDNASCKAAFFKFSTQASQGECYLPSEIFSFVNETSIEKRCYNTSSYIKVLRPHSTSYFRKLVTHLIFSFLLFLFLLSFTLWLFLKHRKRNWEISQGCLEKLSRVVLRFSYNELCSATEMFTEPLGEGGFGMVFKGVLGDGTLVAVKRLDKVGQGTKEFLAEVETLGNIHHVSVVKLVGFCVEKRQKMLVYEYMSNGSLEKWIFDDSKSILLSWEMRKMILLDISKVLAYLHEDCRQRIAHLDVKPENILLDENFKAKLSDFGMSKSIKRDESQVMTGIRGTMGYLAPEWQETGITVKADIYSYGIVLLEIISGRKNLDYSLTESDVHLLSLLQKKSLENRLMDIVVCPSEDMQCHSEEVIQMIRLGVWCLDKDYRRRPSMSLVVKVLEGVTELQANISCNLPFVETPPLASTVSSSSS